MSSSEARNYLPTGPFIPVNQIPNEIRRFLFEKKNKFSFPPGQPRPPIDREALRTMTLLAEISLIVFMCVAVLLVAVMVLICCWQIAACCHERRRSKR